MELTTSILPRLGVESRPYVDGSRFLDALPAHEREALIPDLHVIDVALGRVFLDAGDELTWVDFPIDAMYSIVARFDDGTNCEVGAVGREGLVPADVYLHATYAHRQTICQSSGRSARMSRAAFETAVTQSLTLRRLVEQNVRQRLFFAEQYTACNALHPVLHRCARWLLMTRDATGRDVLFITQDFLATMLGVRRAGVSESIAALAATGAIAHRRGRITVADAPLLARAACSCYTAVREVVESSFAEFERDAFDAGAVTP